MCFSKVPHKALKKELDVITLTYFVNTVFPLISPGSQISAGLKQVLHFWVSTLKKEPPSNKHCSSKCDAY